jgi:hypothetical protein
MVIKLLAPPQSKEVPPEWQNQDPDRPYKCAYCTLTYVKWGESLAKHVSIHHPELDPPPGLKTKAKPDQHKFTGAGVGSFTDKQSFNPDLLPQFQQPLNPGLFPQFQQPLNPGLFPQFQITPGVLAPVQQDSVTGFEPGGPTGFQQGPVL